MYKDKIKRIYDDTRVYIKKSKVMNEDLALEIIDFYENVIEPRTLALEYYKYNIDDFLNIVDKAYEMMDKYIDYDDDDLKEIEEDMDMYFDDVDQPSLKDLNSMSSDQSK